jgi:hypothetical protein
LAGIQGRSKLTGAAMRGKRVPDKPDGETFMPTVWLRPQAGHVAFFGAILAGLCASASANDSTARIGVGGLVFLKNSDVRMVSEALLISPKRVHVRYRFLNESPAPIDAVVAFPMPAFGWNPGESAWDANVGPMNSFAVSVDKRLVAIKVEQKAWLDKRDITAELRGAGLSDAQIFRTFGDMTMQGPRLPSAQVWQLKRLGAFDPNSPAWKVGETAYWQQTFPAQREITVEHTYKPLAGGSYNVFPSINDLTSPERQLPGGPDLENPMDRACLSEGGRSAVLRRMTALFRQGAKTVRVALEDVEYILGTGRNWKGPISNFTLDIMKQSPDQVVSLCFPGKSTRIDDLTLRFQHKNFVPPDRLLVYFYTLKPEE